MKSSVQGGYCRESNCINRATHLDKGIAEDYCYQVEMSIIF